MRSSLENYGLCSTIDPITIHSISAAFFIVQSKHLEDMCVPYILHNRSMSLQIKKIYKKSEEKHPQDIYKMSINEIVL